MNKVVVASLAFMAFAVPAFAADNEIFIPALSPIPFIVTNSGDAHSLSGRVKNWGTLGGGKGGVSDVVNSTVDQLQESECAIHIAVVKDSVGRVSPKDGIASIACMQAGGSVVVSDVPGAITDTSGTSSLKNADVGEKAFFIVQSPVHIPLDGK